MERDKPIHVAVERVRSVLQQQPDHLRLPLERCTVERCESRVTRPK